MTAPATCINCHTPLPEGGRFCPTCGLDASDPGVTEPINLDPDVVTYARLWRAVADHYQFEKVLGRGGMGIVFLAKDLVLERQVALKVLPPDLASDERLVGRFQREARTAAKLDHPGIVPIHAVESIAGYHYFAMKYVVGQSVEDLIEAGSIPVETTLRILGEAASALGNAHQHGVVHRDVKPSNIMMDRHGRAMVMDFGISKAIQSDAGFTQSGQIIGTPHFMSPEQAKGLELDGRSDQYSLALVGWQMFTGKLPFEAASPHTLLLKHITEELPPLKTVRPDVPQHVSDAMARALAKEPHERFATMEDFAVALAGRAAITAPSLRPPTPPSVARTPSVRRSRAWLGVAAVTVAVLAVAVALAIRGGFLPGTATGGLPDSVQASIGQAPPSAAPSPAAPQDTAAPGTAGADSSAAGARLPVTPPRTTEPGAPAQRTTLPAAASPEPAVAAPAPPAVGYLTIDSDPFGTVQVDGVDIGDTPIFNHRLTPGPHQVRIVREGYMPWSQTITITAGNTERRRPILEPVQ